MAFHHDGAMVPGNRQEGSVWPINNICSPFSDKKYSKLFVGGLAWETKSENLHRYFEQFGEIEEAVVIYDRRTGRSKGYGFVTYKDPQAARRACANPNPVVDGREANVNIASLGRPHQPLPPYGVMTWRAPVIRSPQSGSSLYQPQLTYGYHPGYYYPSFRPMIYGPGYLYPQVYGTPSSKKLPDDPTAQLPPPIGHVSSGAYLLPSPNSIHSPGPSFAAPMHYSPGAFAPFLGPPPQLHAMVPAEVEQKGSASN